MSEPANTDVHPPNRADAREVLRAVFAAHSGVVLRIEAAAEAGEICELLADAYCQRVDRAAQRAIRGQMSPEEASLVIARAEFEAFATPPLQAEDRSIDPVVRWFDVVRKPRSEPVDAPGGSDAA